MSNRHLDPAWHIHDNRGRRKYVNAAERERFLVEADRLSPARRAFCHLLVYTGCRVSEGLALTRDQLDPEGAQITFLTLKRRRVGVTRTLPVPPDLTVQLAALPGLPMGKLWTMHRATAWQLVRDVMHRSFITGPMASPKGLRHGFGIRAAECGVTINLIQRWMGHASPLTTAIYLDAVGIEERQFASRMW